MKSKFLFFILTISALLFVSDFIFLKYDLYHSAPHVDIIAHTLGGAVVAAAFLYILSFRNAPPRKFGVLLAVFVVGVLWEVFEVQNGLTHLRDAGYALDTLGDLFFDVFGAYLAYLFIFKKNYGRR